MYQLEALHAVQFFLIDAHTLRFDPTTAIIAPNGAGKSAILDALQIVLLGADRNAIRFNAQAGGSARARSIRDYCLGVYLPGGQARARDTATTYLSLVFRDTDGCLPPVTAGVALGASAGEPEHRIYGLYLLSGVALTLDDHLERVDDDQLPLEWSTFRALAAERCRAADGRLEIESTSRRFLEKLLFALKPESGSIEVDAYRKAFQNALNLQRIEDVDLFVRTLVAEDRPTDVSRFRALLDGFRQIKATIEQVKLRIESAEQVRQAYGRVEGAARRAASYRALSAELARDLHFEALDAADTRAASAREAMAQVDRDIERARRAMEQADDALQACKREQAGQPGFADQASLDQVLERDVRDLRDCKKELLQQCLVVVNALDGAARWPFSGVPDTRVADALRPWRAAVDALTQADPQAGLPAAVTDLSALEAALASVQPLQAALARHTAEAQADKAALDERIRVARSNLERIDRGQSELRPDVLRLQQRLDEAGVPTQPVCDLVRVSDPAWQPAIEAYLRSHVEALIVPPHLEEAAVRVYRGLQGGQRVYGVKLALGGRDDRRMEPPRDGQVAALLEGEHPQALAYLRRQLGDLQQVETEQQVVQARHALTRDGMLVKGGSVERLQLPAAAQLKIGASDLRARRGQLSRDEADAREALRDMAQRLERLSAIDGSLRWLADPGHIMRWLGTALERHAQLHARIAEHAGRLARARNPDLVRLTEEIAQRSAALARARSDYESLLRRQGECAMQCESAERARAALADATASVSAQAVAAFRAPDVDVDWLDQHRVDLETRHPDLSERQQYCAQRADANERELAQHLPLAWQGLAQYGKDHHLAIECAHTDWRAALRLLDADLRRLRDTELVEYLQQAEEAYRTAVVTFRSNVASTLHDNFEKLKRQVATLNRTLERSPAFSNDERYRFRCDVAPEFRELHRFIERVVEVGAEDTLFGSAGEEPAAFRALMEQSVGSGPSALDDYRRFFQFEIEIRQGEQRIGTLSERMKSGSGGEHRAPLYVIAGAALAAAYGKGRGDDGGLGVIMLDEFGDKIDAQNARATTNYLRSLGLQLVLAAPDTAQGTLTGVLDSYIELFRDGDLLEIERIEVKPAARALLESDQFAVHPELLQAETARIEAEDAAGA